MASLLDQLSEMTVVVADTGDLEAIRKFTPKRCNNQPIVDPRGCADSRLSKPD